MIAVNFKIVNPSLKQLLVRKLGLSLETFCTANCFANWERQNILTRSARAASDLRRPGTLTYKLRLSYEISWFNLEVYICINRYTYSLSQEEFYEGAFQALEIHCHKAILPLPTLPALHITLKWLKFTEFAPFGYCVDACQQSSMGEIYIIWALICSFYKTGKKDQWSCGSWRNTSLKQQLISLRAIISPITFLEALREFLPFISLSSYASHNRFVVTYSTFWDKK